MVAAASALRHCVVRLDKLVSASRMVDQEMLGAARVIQTVDRRLAVVIPV
jgi:hypothetical protein